MTNAVEHEPSQMKAEQEQLEKLHADAVNIFTGALMNCNIATAFDRRLKFDGEVLQRLIPGGAGPQQIRLSDYKKIFVIAIGKAANPMLRTLLDRMKRRKGLRGISCSNQLPREKNWRFRYFVSGHPLPDECSFGAARAALSMLKKARKETLVFFLISGGGSAMFDLPLDPSISLEDTISFHESLLACGAPIAAINTLRKHFSAVKGGRLAIASGEATKVSILLPDVPLHSMDALSSGPTSPDHSTVEEVREILDRYGLLAKFPASVRKFFEQEDLPESPGVKGWRRLARLPWQEAQHQPKSPDARGVTAAERFKCEETAFRESVYEVLLSNHDLVQNARLLAEKFGYTAVVDNSCDDWDYADASKYLRARFHELRAQHERLCLISGGEVTVKLGEHPGAGGRNQQFALSCVDDFAQYEHAAMTVLSAGSDGIDGNTQVAGAVADPTTQRRALQFGFEPQKSIKDFDACPLFTALGDAIVLGPTGHNLRDLRVFLADSSAETGK